MKPVALLERLAAFLSTILSSSRFRRPPSLLSAPVLGAGLLACLGGATLLWAWGHGDAPHHESPALPAEPDLANLYPELEGDAVAQEALRRIQEGDMLAALEPPPSWPEVTDRVPARGGPSLNAKAWYAVDQATGEVLMARNAGRSYPIASISKLMGMMIYADAEADPDEILTLQWEDKDFIQITRSRLRVGGRYRAGDLLYHALLPSDNRATVALLRQTHLPLSVFRDAMNRRAAILGLRGSRFMEPTGLDAGDVSTAREVTLLLHSALSHPRLEPVLTTKEHYYYRDDKRIMLGARSSNRLSHTPSWDVIASKTGFTYAAGSCLVMDVRLADGRRVSLSILGASGGERGRYPEAEAMKRFLEQREGVDAADEDDR